MLRMDESWLFDRLGIGMHFGEFFGPCLHCLSIFWDGSGPLGWLFGWGNILAG